MCIKTPSLCGCLVLCIELSSDTQGYISYTNPTISYSRARNAWLYCFAIVSCTMTLIVQRFPFSVVGIGKRKAGLFNDNENVNDDKLMFSPF